MSLFPGSSYINREIIYIIHTYVLNSSAGEQGARFNLINYLGLLKEQGNLKGEIKSVNSELY